jgi:hypothetical protein
MINTLRLMFKKQYKTVVKQTLPDLGNWGSSDNEIANFVENKMKAFVEILKSFLVDEKLDWDFRVSFPFFLKIRTSVGRPVWS